MDHRSITVDMLMSRIVAAGRASGIGIQSGWEFKSPVSPTFLKAGRIVSNRFTVAAPVRNMTDSGGAIDGNSAKKRRTMTGASSKKSSSSGQETTTTVYDPVTMRKPKKSDCVTIVSWNVAGLRAFLKKASDDLDRLVGEESPDIFCIQEHKLQDGTHGEDARVALHGYFPECGYQYWNFSTVKKGYSGTAILSKKEPVRVTYGLNHEEHSENDEEGRIITAEFDSFYVVNTYVPNSGAGLKRLDYRVQEWDVALSKHVKALEEQHHKPVVLVGDMNCAAEEIDIHSPKTNLRSAGFTIEERESFAARYLKNGMTDVFRTLHPGVIGYTYWGYRFNLRAKNKGWRLDYFLVSDSLFDRVYDCFHLPSLMGSDHAPLGIAIDESN